MNTCRMTLPDGSRPRAYMGFALKDLPTALSPLVKDIWLHLPFKGKLSDFPISVTAQQLAGACKSGQLAMVRRGRTIHIVRRCDPEFQEVLSTAKRRRVKRRQRKIILNWESTAKPLSPLVAKIWDHLPYKGPISRFPVPLTVHQLAGACKSKRVAMIRRQEEVLIVSDIDVNYDDVLSLGKDRRTWDDDFCIDRVYRDCLWNAYLLNFPHPAA
jgi:hypothetical protein